MQDARPQRPSKAVWRATLRNRLDAIDVDTAARAAARVAERLLALPEVRAAERVLCCLSFGSELDTWRLVDELLTSGRQVFVPRVAAGDPMLHLHPFPCTLTTLSFGLRQPAPGAPELAPDAVDQTIDVALVLGLGFDRRGVRLGHGAGYFDRFLAGRPFPAIGICQAAQLVVELPAEPHDQRMAAVVTEDEAWRPGDDGRPARRR